MLRLERTSTAAVPKVQVKLTLRLQKLRVVSRKRYLRPAQRSAGYLGRWHVSSALLRVEAGSGAKPVS
jgi:hypothetical protein